MNASPRPLLPRFRSLAACALAAALPGCIEAEPRDLGLTQSSENLGLEPSPSADEPFYVPREAFAGRWVGSARDLLAPSDSDEYPVYRFPSGSSRIVLDVGFDEADSLIGQITFGEAPPLPPVVDPNVGYPPGVDYQQLLGYELEVTEGVPIYTTRVSGLPPFEGFGYRALEMAGLHAFGIPDGVAVFGFATPQPLEDWCMMQTPRPHFGEYSCIDEQSFAIYDELTGELACTAVPPEALAECERARDACISESPDDTGECWNRYEACFGSSHVPIDCNHYEICRDFCECSEHGCWAANTLDQLRVRRSGDELIGVFESTLFENARGLNVPLGEVRLRREP